MPDLPPLEKFPECAGNVPSSSIHTVIEAFGALTAQDGDDLHQIHINLALGPSPADGFATLVVDAEAAREIAEHLNYLANYAEQGVEAGPSNE